MPVIDFLAGLAVTAGLAKPAVRSTEAVDWRSMPLPGIDGTPLDPENLRGKVVLLVNTASACGFTPQYAGLQKLWEQYRDRGLVVLGVPSNDFGSQDPKPDADIHQFCQARFGVTFPLLAKQVVKGERAHPLYRWARSQTGRGGAPAWNFHKYVIGRDGTMRAWYPSMAGPSSSKLRAAVEAALTLMIA